MYHATPYKKKIKNKTKKIDCSTEEAVKLCTCFVRDHTINILSQSISTGLCRIGSECKCKGI